MPNIPNIMSFFWSSPKLSWMRYLTVASFCKINPTWDVRIYSCSTPTARTWKTNELIDSQDYAGEDYTSLLDMLPIKRCRTRPHLKDAAPSYESDLFSFYQLGTTGGWYADMDILWIKPMPSVTESVVFCKTCNIFGIGFMASVPDCRLWIDVYYHAKHSYNKQEYQSCGVLALNSYLRNDQNIRSKYPQYPVACLPTETVYPFDFRQVEDIFNTTAAVPEEAIGIHWFGGHPLSQQWNCLLNRNNFKDFNNTFTKYGSELCL